VLGIQMSCYRFILGKKKRHNVGVQFLSDMSIVTQYSFPLI